MKEVPEWAEKSPRGTLCVGQERGTHHSDVGTDSPTEEGSDGLLSDCPPDEMSGDECWDLEPTPTGLGGVGWQPGHSRDRSNPLMEQAGHSTRWGPSGGS